MKINRFGKIVTADHSGDTAIAEFEPGVDSPAAKVAQDKLTAFLNDCVTRYGKTPPVWGKRLGAESYTPFNRNTDRIIDCETILLQNPMVGG